MNHYQFMELLQEIEDNEFNDHMFFANVCCLSHGRVLQRFIVLLPHLIQDFLETKKIFNIQRENISVVIYIFSPTLRCT